MTVRPAVSARRWLPVAGMLLGMMLLGGCDSGNTVDVKFHGYTLQASRPAIKTGDIVFNIANTDGQVLHQFIVAQTEFRSDRLPLGANSQVDETQLKIVGKVDKIDLGQSSTLTVHLAPGHYVLLCNIVGHYQLGMHADFIAHP